MDKNSLYIFVLFVWLLMTSDLSSQNINCSDIKWIDYEIKTDSTFAYYDSIKLAEIDGVLFNKINEEIIKKIFNNRVNDDPFYYLSHYFLTQTKSSLNPQLGFTSFVTNAYCVNKIFSYQIEGYTIGAKQLFYQYINYDFQKERNIVLEDIVIESKEGSFKKFMSDYMNRNKNEIIENLKELLQSSMGYYSLNYLDVLDNPAYDFNKIHIKNEINLRYFNSKGIIFSLQFRDINLLEIENHYQYDGFLDSFILVSYKDLKDFIYSDFYPNN
ncbi:MAG: hypothetical protein LAT51_10340 [Flavobacteriaceae bacterium]|nr:hypothetical protein [Flavobacteriaceae bacterium]